MTPRQVANMVKGYQFATITLNIQKTVQWGVPISISIEPTTSCNLRCPKLSKWFAIIYQANRNAESDFFRQTIDALHKDLTYLIFFIFRENHISIRRFLEMVR